MPDRVTIPVPFPPKSKVRPRVTMRGVFNDRKYEEWKADVRSFVVSAVGAIRMEGPLKCELVLHKEHFVLTLEQSDADYQYLRGDVDNMAGGIFDALQGKGSSVGLIGNDSQIRELRVRVADKDEK